MDHDGGGRVEAERLIGIAEKLLIARDLVGSKKFAERAMELDPLLDGVDQILAVADVLLAAQRRVNNQVDWHSILQLDPSISAADPSAVSRHYRRLALLLRPDCNEISGADAAFRLVSNAYGVLSDLSKRSLFEAEIKMAAATNGGAPPADPSPFWTACSSCCHVHQYAGAHRNRRLRCPTCRQPLTASETTGPPPIVPGTDTYFCSWGFFPLGFPGGPNFTASGTGSPDFWKPFHQAIPQPSYPDQGKAKENNAVVEPEPELHTSPVRNQKKMARKKVGSVGPNKFSARAEKMMPAGININEEVTAVDGDEMSHADIDLDVTDEMLGNLHNIPFFKDEDIQMQIP